MDTSEEILYFDTGALRVMGPSPAVQLREVSSLERV